MMEPSVACLWYFADRETNSLRPGRKSPRCPQRVSSRRRPGCTETVPRIKFGKSVSPTTIMAMLWLDCAGARVQQVRLPVRRDEDLPPENKSGGLGQLQRDGQQRQPPGPRRGEDQGDHTFLNMTRYFLRQYIFYDKTF